MIVRYSQNPPRRNSFKTFAKVSDKPADRYDPRVEEPRWQKIWAERETFVARNDDPRPPY
jgi:hypothetical protein